MGWDDNGLATERRVQNFYGVRCDPSLPVEPDFTPPEKPGDREIPISRQRLRRALRHARGRGREEVRGAVAPPRPLGRLGDDLHDHRRACRGARRSARSCACWPAVRRTRRRRRRSGTSTTAPRSRRPSSRTASWPARTTRSRSTGPTARADILIETTRPELLPACVALVAHPDDARYADRFGQSVRTPLFGVPVPVVAHPLADPEKGSGIAMICTFGDTTDVVWWRELQLPMRNVIGRDGRLLADRPSGGATVDAAAADAVRGARGQDGEAGAGADRRAARRDRRARRRAEADHAPGEVLRARSAPARDRDVAAVVLPQRRTRAGAARRVPRARRGARTGTRRTCSSATTRGSRG